MVNASPSLPAALARGSASSQSGTLFWQGEAFS
jgi:hypothetical protein